MSRYHFYIPGDTVCSSFRSLKEDNKVDVTVQSLRFPIFQVSNLSLKEDNKVDVTVHFFLLVLKWIVFPRLKEDNKVDVTVLLPYSC